MCYKYQERATENGELGTGVWERVYSGNPLENSKWRTKQKKRPQESRLRNNLKRELIPAVPLDDQYVLVRAESDWHWDKQSMRWHLSRKSNLMSSACARQQFSTQHDFH